MMRREQRVGHKQASAAKPRRSLKRGNAHAPQPSGMLFLASSGVYVPVIDGVDRASTAQLIGEDLCWQFARADWQARKPRPWRRSAVSRWRAEGLELRAKRDRLIELLDGVRSWPAS